MQADTQYWQAPTLVPTRRMVSGVSAAIADELGVDVLLVRALWILMFAAGGWGALFYLVTWAALSWTTYRNSPVAEPRTPKGRSSRTANLGTLLVGIGIAGLASNFVGAGQSVLWPVAMMGMGVLVSWRRFGPQALDRSTGSHPMAQAVAGLLLTLAGALLIVFVVLGASGLAFTFYLVILLTAVAALITAPRWWAFLQGLDRERQAKAVADERAVLNAHLHDSVLQTLSLIQRNSEDPQVMLNLARRQERELRNWLDPDRASRLGGSVRGYLDDMATEIEELYGTPVEVVSVGDCLVDKPIEHALAAAREAVVNAAKHSNADQVDIYVEATDVNIEIFVRDRGIGFDPEAVSADRRGIRESIDARMRRVGGVAVIESVIGEGTEVELCVPRSKGESTT